MAIKNGVTFTREFFKFLKLMIEREENAIPFFCEYYEEGKYAEEISEDGWPILNNFDENTYPFHLVVGPINNKGLHRLSVIQNPDSKGYENNLLELLDMTEAGEDSDIQDGKKIGNLTAEQAYEYVSKKYEQYQDKWIKLMPWF